MATTKDLEVNNLSVAKHIVVPGKAVINELLVRSLYVELPQQQPLLAQAPPPPLSREPIYYQQIQAPALSASPKIAQVFVRTTCVIPLSLAGTGNWLNLKECALFTDATPECLQPGSMLALSPTNEHLLILKAGVYKIDCCIRIGSCGYGQHNFNIGIGVGNEAPIRSLASCISFGATLEMTGAASGILLIEVPEDNSELQIYLRDDSTQSTDASVFQGTLILTQIC